MKLTEIRALSADDLNLQVERLRRDLFKMKFKGAVESLAQSHKLREMRRDIARSLTVANERARAGKVES